MQHVMYLVWVQLDQLVVVCLGKCKQGGGQAAMRPCMSDVAHAKEEAHLAHYLDTSKYTI